MCLVYSGECTLYAWDMSPHGYWHEQHWHTQLGRSADGLIWWIITHSKKRKFLDCASQTFSSHLYFSCLYLLPSVNEKPRDILYHNFPYQVCQSRCLLWREMEDLVKLMQGLMFSLTPLALALARLAHLQVVRFFSPISFFLFVMFIKPEADWLHWEWCWKT